MAKTKWTEAMVETMLRILYEQVLQGERAENGFKKKAWTAAKEGLRVIHNIDLEASQLKAKWSNLKKDYDTYTAIKNNSGFGWDNIQGVPTAPDSVWDAYLKAHPEAEKFCL
ncbi:hypothetical protein L873DRAFT_1667700 [Choiromyces venosus 120613-1]|uniref:Myb/SANT-like domain-containing protein n=1 Tax=Choiromyces venosus 120613-1 TaxID=1336337 RepID=A0A3N4K103_9PEZI|nr:hypothetical protein L873DRAFT_1667700 [Choiromyces venosus 120613-1]